MLRSLVGSEMCIRDSINIVNEDLLLIHPKDAANRDLNTGDIGRLYSGRGEVALKVEVTDKVKEGIVFTTFHFPEHMVNMVTGHGKDEETMCAEYKVSSVEVQKISNQFKTEVKPKDHQAEDGIRDAQESRGLGDVYKRQY